MTEPETDRRSRRGRRIRFTGLAIVVWVIGLMAFSIVAGGDDEPDASPSWPVPEATALGSDWQLSQTVAGPVCELRSRTELAIYDHAEGARVGGVSGRRPLGSGHSCQQRGRPRPCTGAGRELGPGRSGLVSRLSGTLTG